MTTHHITVHITMPDPKGWGRGVAIARLWRVLRALGPDAEFQIEEEKERVE